jgi:hypothetical protein
MNEPIPLSQKLYLLGIHPQKGGIIMASNSPMRFVLSGALLLELYKNGNIKFEDKRVILLNTKTKNETHRFFLEKMSVARSPKKISTWINRINFRNKLIYRDVQKGLVDKRIIAMREKHFLFFKWKSPVILNRSLVYHLVDDVKSWISNGTLDEEQLILLSFIRPAKLHHRLYSDRNKRIEADRKLKNLSIDNQVSKSVQDAIQAAQAVAASVSVSAAVSAGH